MNQAVLAARRWSLLYTEDWSSVDSWRLRGPEWRDQTEADREAAGKRCAAYFRRRVPVEIEPMALDPDRRCLAPHMYVAMYQEDPSRFDDETREMIGSFLAQRWH